MSEVLAQLEKKGGGNWREVPLYSGRTIGSVSIAPYNVSDFDAFKIRTMANVAADSWWDFFVFGIDSQIGHMPLSGPSYASAFSLTDGGTELTVSNRRYGDANWQIYIMEVIGIKF